MISESPAAHIQAAIVSLLALAAWLSTLSRRRKLRVTALALIAIGAIALAQLSHRTLHAQLSSLLDDWLPAALLLIPYWQVGQFVTTSNPRMESRFVAFDRAFFQSLGMRPGKVPISAALGMCLETAYLMVYPLIPLGLASLYLAGLKRYANYYWIVVLTSTYVCLAITPFIQAMPPRELRDDHKFRMPPSRIEKLNHWILRRASIRVITFPSAHVASAFAATLVLLRLDPGVGLIFLAAALSIALATVAGGYHYAADVLLAVVAAVGIFLATLSTSKPS